MVVDLTDYLTNHIKVSRKYIEKRKKLEKEGFSVGGEVEDENNLEARSLIKTRGGVFSHVAPLNPSKDYPRSSVSPIPCAILYSDGKLEDVNGYKKGVESEHKKLKKLDLVE